MNSVRNQVSFLYFLFVRSLYKNCKKTRLIIHPKSLAKQRGLYQFHALIIARVPKLGSPEVAAAIAWPPLYVLCDASYDAYDDASCASCGDASSCDAFSCVVSGGGRLFSVPLGRRRVQLVVVAAVVTIVAVVVARFITLGPVQPQGQPLAVIAAMVIIMAVHPALAPPLASARLASYFSFRLCRPKVNWHNF